MTSMDITTPALRSRSNSPKVPSRKETRGGGIQVHRFFTKPGVDVFDTCEWDLRTAMISNERGEVVFEQKDVEMPKFWSQMATNVVVSKYFRGHVGTEDREKSVRQLNGRVVRTMTQWGREGGYFATAEDGDAFRDELTHILLYQMASFNSPVWFNVGVETRPQCSACFINSVADTMDSILTLAKTEGMLFKYGSGTGSNLSNIRSSKELLAGGGTASGPVSFMRGYDSFAGVGLRRSRHAVRHDRERLESVRQHSAHQRIESVLRIHVPRRLGVQSRFAESDALLHGCERIRR